MAFLDSLRLKVAGLIAPEQKNVSFLVAGESGGRSNLLYRGVDKRAADNNSIVMACVGWAMRNIKHGVPVVQKEGEDGWETLPGHPCAEVVRTPQGRIVRADRTRMTGGRMSAAMVHQLMFDGNGYQHIVRNGSGQIIGLEFLPSFAVDPVERRDLAGVVDYYNVSLSNGLYEKVPPEDMVHHQVGVDPHCTVKGISPLKSVMRQVLTDNEIAVYSHSIMKMPSPGLMVTPKPNKEGIYSMNKDEANDLAKAIQEKSSGEKSGGVITPTVPMEIAKLRMSPDEMALDVVNKLPEERITAVFGIPAIVAGMGAGLERSTFSNMAEAREAAAEEFLIPMWSDMADTYTTDLLENFGNTDGLRFWFDSSGVRSLMEDEDAKHARTRDNFNANLINRAEARTQIGEKPQTGDDKVFAYMLKPGPMVPGDTPQGPKDAARVRKEAEGR